MNIIRIITELYHIVIKYSLSNIIKLVIRYVPLIMNSPNDDGDD